MNSPFQGGCHRGALRFEVGLDLSAGTVKCSCTCCAKSRLWHARVETGDFRASGETTDYRGRNPVTNRFLCPCFGINIYDRFDTPNILGRPYVNASVVCLDDIDVEELIEGPIRYCGGLNDDWGSIPKETRHL
jgi:hypothetical protein